MRYWLFILLWGIPGLLQAQTFGVPVRFTTENGLSHNYCTGIVEDDYGFIWTGTHEGLNRYDGTSFNVYLSGPGFPLPSNFINVMKKMGRHRIFIGTSEGGAILDTRTMTLLPLALPRSAQYRLSHEVTDAAMDQGQLLVGTNHYIAVYDSTFRLVRTLMPPHGPEAGMRFAISFFSLPDGAVFIQQHAGNGYWEMMRLNQDHKSYAPENKVFGALHQTIFNPWKCLLTAWRQEGPRIYFSLVQKDQSYLSVFELRDKRMTTSPLQLPGTEPRIYNTIPVNDSLLIISSFYGHPLLYNRHTQALSAVTANDSLWFSSWPEGYYNFYCRTRSGIWVSAAKGLYYLPFLPQGIMRVPALDSAIRRHTPNSMVTGIEKVGGYSVLNVLSQGFFIADSNGHRFRFERPLPPFRGLNITLGMYPCSGDTIWMPGQYGCGWYDVGAGKSGWLRVPGQPAWLGKDAQGKARPVSDSKGNVWFFFQQGLVRYRPSGRQFRTYEGTMPGLSFAYGQLNGAAEDRQGRLWFTGNGTGLIRYDHSTDRFVQERPYLSTQDTMVRTAWQVVSDGREGLFLITRKGLLYYYLPRHLSRLYTKADGLSTIDITAMTMDAEQRLWIAGSNGLSCFNPRNGTFLSYFRQDGLPDNSVVNVQLWDTARNILAVSFEDGFCYIDPQQLRRNDQPPATIITGIAVNNQPVVLPVSRTLSLDYSNNNISIAFTGINFNRGNLNRYAYMLQGRDRGWNYTSNQTVASFFHLPPGEYLFRVKSCNHQGVWDETPDTLRLVIRPPFWRTWWFALCGVVGAGCGIGLLFVLQRRKFRKQEREKLRINNQINDLKMTALRTQLNPHFIFNALNSIQYFVLDNNPHEASRYLSRFARLFRLVLDNASNNFILLKKEIEWLSFYAEIEALRFNNRFRFTFETDAGIDASHIQIPSMLIQPHIENAILHGLGMKEEGGLLQVRFFAQEPGVIHCTITDNGIGRTAAAELGKAKQGMRRESKGTSLIRERIALLQSQYGLHARYDIEDLYDADGYATGTRVHLLLPIQNQYPADE